ncbi:hypothetical protein K3G39_20375 [Pontibacter sp. HSC-14F20]|nr:hypothetical protein [Pontibacter sp. HSC-14F20]
MLKALLFLSLAAGVGYFLFYPFLKNVVNRKLLMKWFFIAYAIAILISTINTYFL